MLVEIWGVMRDVFFPFFLSSDGARLSGLCSPMLEVSRPVLYGFCNFVEAESNEYDYMHYS